MIVNLFDADMFQLRIAQLKNWFCRLVLQASLLAEKAQNQKEDPTHEHLFSDVFDNSMVAVFRIRLQDGLILRGNKRAFEMLGMNQLSKIFITDFCTDLENNLRIAVILRQKKKIKDYNLKMIHSSGKSIWVSVSGKYNEEKDTFEGIAQDITQNKDILGQLNEANFELDNFIYRASHNLRSPLLSIVGLVNLIETEEDLKNIRQYSQYILKSINRLDNTIQEMMVVTKGQRIEEKTTKINFRKLTEEAWQHLSYLENHPHVCFRIKIKKEANFYGSKENIKTILNALLSNAVQYSSGSRKPLTEVDICINASNAVIVVKDNGDGIKPEIKERVFEMFYRGSERSQGAGLGLYTVKKLVTKAGGEIILETVYKKGSVFIIKIPNQVLMHKVSKKQKVHAIKLLNNMS